MYNAALMKNIELPRTEENKDILGQLMELIIKRNSEKGWLTIVCEQVNSNYELFEMFEENGNKLPYKGLNLEAAIKKLDSKYWRKVFEETNIFHLLPAKKRDELSNSLYEAKVEPFEEATVFATMNNMADNADDFFVEKVEDLYRNLSSNYKTNSVKGFTEKFVFSGFNSWYGGRNEVINDLRMVIALISGFNFKDNPNTQDDINLSKNFYDSNGWHKLDGGALEIKTFSNGNAHIKIDKIIAVRLNQILSKSGKMQISAKEEPKRKNKGATYSNQELIHFEVRRALRIWVLSDIIESNGGHILNYRIEGKNLEKYLFKCGFLKVGNGFSYDEVSKQKLINLVLLGHI